MSIEHDMLVRFRYLKRIKNQLAAGRISVSDAILSALKLSRGAIPEGRLRLLNRELLGYLDEESKYVIGRFKDTESIATAWESDIPLHRLLVGSWVPLSASLMRGAHQKPALEAKDHHFYSEGICELETLLQRVTISDQTWISVATDDELNRVFMCTTSALQNLYDLAKARLCDYLEYLAQDIKEIKAPDGAAEARLILLLTKRVK